MIYTIMQTEPKLWTVGYYDQPGGIFHPVSDHGGYQEAKDAADLANGLRTPKMVQDERLEKFVMAAMQGFLASWAGSNSNPAPASVGKKAVEYAQATLAELDKYAKDPENYFIK